MKILNLTQHTATADQIEAGVVDLPAPVKACLIALLTFDSPPDQWMMVEQAKAIAAIPGVTEYLGTDKAVMIGGMPAFMPPLQTILLRLGFTVLYSFTKRVTEEVAQPDGSVKKTQVFKHAGWTKAEAVA